MSVAKIKAGEAFWEATVRDKTNPGLSRAMAKVKLFAATVRASSAGLANFGSTLRSVGAAGAAMGAGLTAALGGAVRTFLEISKQAKDAGRAIAGVDPSKAERLQEAWERLRASFSAAQFTAGGALAEPLTNAAESLSAAFVHIGKFISANPETFQTFAKITAGIVTASAALVGLGVTFGVVATAMKGFAAVGAALGSAMVALVTPFGLVVAALVAVGAAIIAVRLNWEAVMRAMISATAEMVAVVGTLIKSMERDFGIDLGSKSFDRWSKEIRDMTKLFPDIKATSPSVAAVVQQARGAGREQATEPALGSMRGTWSGVRAENLSIGNHVWQKEDKRHSEEMDRLDRILESLKKIEAHTADGSDVAFQ